MKRHSFASSAILDLCKNDYRIPLLYQFLQISRAYREAHEFANGTGKATSRNDFDMVLATYNLFGDVWSNDIETWWSAKASEVLTPTKRPLPEVVMRVKGLASSKSQLLDLANLKAVDEVDVKLHDYFYGKYLDQGSPDLAMLAVPLEGDRTEILESIDALLKKEWWSRSPVPSKPEFSFAKWNVRQKTLETYLFAVHELAEHGHTILQLGNIIQNRFGHSKPVSKNFVQSDDNLTRQTLEELRFAYLISDWAALGRFPSKDGVKSVPILDADDGTKRKFEMDDHFDLSFIEDQIAKGRIVDIAHAL